MLDNKNGFRTIVLALSTLKETFNPVVIIIYANYFILGKVMITGPVALIGLGVIGTPIAHKLNNAYHDNFMIVARGQRREKLESQHITINGEPFVPRILSDKSELVEPLSLLIVCVKNYNLNSSLEDIKAVISKETIILPLQNGIYSYDFFCKKFPSNIILQGYMQGPNTEKNGEVLSYTNPGAMHMGDQANSVLDTAAKVYAYLGLAGVDVHLEQDIKKMVWKKMMLNVAGNSVTALTDANYSDFKKIPALQALCRNAMNEFVTVAHAEGIMLTNQDIEDVINYYVTYRGEKMTSMLEDVRHKRKTENDYLAGNISKLALKHNISVPIIDTLYSLISIKEKLYQS